MSTLKVTTLDTCTTIKDSGSNTRITLSATSPHVALGNQTDVIRALNTAKCWGSIYGGTNSVGQTYNVSSWQDIGSNQRRVNFAVAFSNNQYAVAGYTAQGDSIAQDNLTCIGNKTASYFQMSSNNQTGGYNPEGFSNAGWVVFANNGGA